MKLGELFIQLTTKGDVKKLDEAIAKMEKVQAKEKERAQFRQKILRVNKLIEKATKSEQVERLKNIKAQIKDNYVNKIKLDNLKNQSKSLKEQQAQWHNMLKGVTAFAAGISATIVAMDRLGNSVLKTNQLYTNFSKQTGISIGNLNKIAGVAKLSGMNLPVEQVAGDLNSLQQKIFRLGVTGEGSGIFAQLGMNPIGMNSDQFIDSLRHRLKGLNEQQKSYIVDELGLSREWLNVLNLSDSEYSNILEQSKSLQLTEKERKQLAQYTLIQQKNNMRWELAKQRLAIALIPIITKIMDATSKIAVSISNSLGNEKIVNIIRDVALWLGIASLRASGIQKALSFLFAGGLFKGLGGLLGAGAVGKTTAKLGAKTLGKGLLGAAGGPIGWAMLAWTAADIFSLLKEWFNKDTQDDGTEPPIDTSSAYNYRYMNSNMVNNFYNNPAPQNIITDEISNYMTRYLAETRK